MKKTVVFDFNLPMLLNNKLFNRAEAYKISHTNMAICFLCEQAKLQDIEFITPDIYLAHPKQYPGAVLISHQVTEFTKKILAAGARPLLLLCLESPFIATKFYLQLKKYSSWFTHSFLFKGMKKQTSSKTVFHTMYYPQEFDLKKFSPVLFAEKKFLTMISGNKQLSNWKKSCLLKFLYGAQVKNVYAQRVAVVDYFSAHSDFDLFGLGWEQGAGNQSSTSNIQKVYRGTVEDKWHVMRNYKFAFCFENSIFPGYITEKIFDAFFSGCVPVYLGASDITDFVPAACFINLLDFGDFSALDKFLQSIGEKQYNEYIEQGRKFLQSDKYYKFSEQYFAQEILQIVNLQFQNA